MARKSAPTSASHNDLLEQEQQASPEQAPAPEKSKLRFRVAVKGYPVTGFVETLREAVTEKDAEGNEVLVETKRKVVHPSRPVTWHYRRPAKDIDSEIPDGWFTATQLKGFGLDAVPAGFRKRKRVRSDLTSALFEGAVIEAESEYEAREKFARLYGILDTKGKNWVVSKAKKDDQVGPFSPKKIRGLLSA